MTVLHSSRRRLCKPTQVGKHRFFAESDAASNGNRQPVAAGPGAIRPIFQHHAEVAQLVADLVASGPIFVGSGLGAQLNEQPDKPRFPLGVAVLRSFIGDNAQNIAAFKGKTGTD